MNMNKNNFAGSFSEKKGDSILSEVLKTVELAIVEKGNSISADTQIYLEKKTLDCFDLSKHFFNGLNNVTMNSHVGKYILDKKEVIEKYINNLIKSSSNKIKGSETMNQDQLKFTNEILNVIDKNFLTSICIHKFLTILSYQATDFSKLESLLAAPMTVNIGRTITSRYFKDSFFTLKEKYESYSDFIEDWKKNNDDYSNLLLEDDFYAKLGGKLIDILLATEMITVLYVKGRIRKEDHYEYRIKDQTLVDKTIYYKVIPVPSKLPMLVKPKEYSRNSLGGYLLNDIDYKEGLFIEKNAYKYSSHLDDNNQIYKLVNNLSSVPFKINVDLLNSLFNENKHLLINPNEAHPSEGKIPLTKYDENIIKSHKSKIVLQETIMELAMFYKNYPQIYFPVRLDQRGRIYCTSSYLNYQSNELAKALLLFSVPGIIHRTNLEAIKYLKAYGATHFGGNIKRKSLTSKIEWVDQNLNDIINYNNGTLLHLAEEKILFLAFCIEYKRFHEFYIDENQTTFDTYLPIQLDATCNGFQHMALLSNEQKLFKELNLIPLKPSDNPKDFYNFLLHRLHQIFENKLDKNEIIDEKTEGSYKRLHDFVWDRKNIKKAIMTIPYNATKFKMKQYLLDTLYKIEFDKESNIQWYTDIKRMSNQNINEKDSNLLVDCIHNVIYGDFPKIKKLCKYLDNIALLYNTLELPISWHLPTGLNVHQSYLKTKSTTVMPFAYKSTKFNLKITTDKLDTKKQTRALMPNLIHSLDATSLSLMNNLFTTEYGSETQFFSIHDCFGTTADKVFVLKTMLASVYTDLYSNELYLRKFDEDILINIAKNTDFKINKTKRTVQLENQEFIVHDIDWVLNKKNINKDKIKRIDSQYILI